MKRKKKKSIYLFWGRNFIICEMLLVLILWLAFIVWTRLFGGEKFVINIIHCRRGLIYGTLATIEGSLLGFVIAAQSIVLGLSGSEKLDIVRQSRHYSTLWNVFRWSIRILAIATMASLTALIFDCDKSPCIFWLYMCLLFTMLAIAQLGRTIWILERVVIIVSSERR